MRAWLHSGEVFSSWLRRTSSPAAADAATETVSSAECSPRDGTARALYVSGPNGGSRHLLPEGVVCVLGRGGEATIVVDDPRVSRSHAAVHVLDQVMLSDLGSANGTFLGKHRLRSGEVRPLGIDQSFFIGDSVLVVRATSLPRCCPQRVSSIDDVRERLGDRGFIVVSVRSFGPDRARSLEPILSELLQSPRDWLMRIGDRQVLVGVEADAAADASSFERAVLGQLGSWGTVADVESRLLSRDQLEPNGSGLLALMRGEAPLVLNRGRVIVRDPAMHALVRTVSRLAPAAVNVLIEGETGVGKDVVASMLHELSPRVARPFVGLNCASLPEALLESELFGHERGAFTGAASAKPGLFEAAPGGTIFLDEIGDLPLSLQAKLLRVIETREITRLGGLRPRPIDVRFIAATNKDLGQQIAAGRFREDLYYRLRGVRLAVPPLRERPGEIEPLAHLFLEASCQRSGAARLHFSHAAIAALSQYAWPGNVRELRNVIEHAVLLATDEVIEPGHLGLPAVRSEPPPAAAVACHAAVESTTERDRIARALEACAGNQTRAARLLAIPRRTLVRRIQQLGLRRPRA